MHWKARSSPQRCSNCGRLHGDHATLADDEALYGYTDFQSFLMAFKAVSAHLRGPDDYELITYRLMQR